MFNLGADPKFTFVTEGFMIVFGEFYVFSSSSKENLNYDQ